MQKQLLIGEVAEQVGANPKTIRYYEDIALLPPPDRSEQGWRVYSQSDVDRLRFVRGARTLGVSLEDIREFLAFRDLDEPPCLFVLDRIKREMEAVDKQIAALQQLKGELVSLHDEGLRLPTDKVEMKECVCQLIENRALQAGPGSRDAQCTAQRRPGPCGHSLFQ